MSGHRSALKLGGILITLVVLSGCPPTERQIERGIEAELPRIVGPAQRYEVNVEGVRGTRFARRVTATGIRVQPAGSPVLDRVDVELLDVEYDARQGEVVRIAQADAMVRILDTDIATFLELNRNVSRVEVELEPPNHAVVRAEPQIPQLTLPPGVVLVTATGTLEAAGQVINYNVTEVTAAGLPLPGLAVQLISQELNPIVDLRGMAIALEIVDIQVEGNAVLVHVRGEYPAP